MIACQIHREAGRILLPINEAFGTVLLNSQARACGGVRKFFLLLVVPEALTRSKAHMVGQPRNSRDALVSFALVEVLIDAVFEVQGVTVFRVPACFGVIFSHDHYRETLRFRPLVQVSVYLAGGTCSHRLIPRLFSQRFPRFHGLAVSGQFVLCEAVPVGVGLVFMVSEHGASFRHE